jgi:hypothetical protein
MEIQFVKKPLQYLKPFYTRVQTQEQTQEVRLPDAYPDIGKILWCWGQVLIRGKEWRSTGMGASGGVTARILYAPEDGTQLRVVEAWLPFQWRWDFPEVAEDGVIELCPVIAEMDCRGISARKIMVRAVVSNCAQAMTKGNAELASIPETPEDVQLLTRTYPMDLPVEAGEKQVQIEEGITIPDPNGKLISYCMIPSIQEQKVLGDRLVFRGIAGVSVTYLTEDGQISKWETEFPFSHYTELDRDYCPSASSRIQPILTAIDVETNEEMGMQLRAGIAAQYTIFDRMNVDVVEDAFSPKRDVKVSVEQLQLPALLESTIWEITPEASIDGEIMEVLAVRANHEYPMLTMGEKGTEISVDGQFCVLYKDNEGQILTDSVQYDYARPFESDFGSSVYLWPGNLVQQEVITTATGVGLRSCCNVTAQVYSGQMIPMVTGMDVGERKEPDPNRPSIILRRAGEEGIWNIAKGCGSTVAAIREANQLTDEPVVGQMLLIPIV